MNLFFKKYITIALAFFIASKLNTTQASPLKPNENIEQIDIFVHGTHGALLTGKASTAWRKTKRFYSDRLMSGQMGLVSYESLDRDILAPYILDAYEEILHQTNINSSHQFYLFNWSGILSDSERQKAGSLLHEALKLKIDALKKEGKNPVISLYGHSWGGAVCAYLGDYDDIQDWNIQLMMLATPIDSKTEDCINRFCEKNGNVTHLYSDNDIVQIADILSSTDDCTRSRIKLTNQNTRITQMRIKTESTKTVNFWETIRGGGNPLSLCPQDPNHADFWCIDWEKDNLFYSPLPVIVWSPILWLLAEKSQKHDLHDLDVHIKSTEKNALFSVQEYVSGTQTNNTPVLYTYQLPLETVKKAQDKLLVAKTKTQKKEVNILQQN